MPLILNTDHLARSYKRFIKDFRQQDKTLTAGQAIDVNIGNRTFHFKAKNFQFTGWSQANSRTNLADYNHVLPSDSVGITDIISAFTSCKGNKMDRCYSMIVVFTSEAARSAPVYRTMMSLIQDGKKKINLKEYECYFNNYGKTIEYNRFWVGGNYTSSWRPLEQDDYLHWINTAKYTGDRTAMLASFDKVKA